MGTLLLEGGAEFGGQMSEPDLRAIQIAGGPKVPIAVLPTAAAPDHNHERAGRNAIRWFSSLGASHPEVVPVIDRASADDALLADRIRSARLIYILGGFPAYVAQTLSGSRAWQAALDAYQSGAVLGGSSAGAMVLCQYLYDPEQGTTVPGLNLIPNACVLPHHNGFGKNWAPRLRQALPDATLIGIDEQTGMLDDDPTGAWTVHGAGQVTLYHSGAVETYSHGQRFKLPG
jgi:cyanophycinase